MFNWISWFGLEMLRAAVYTLSLFLGLCCLLRLPAPAALSDRSGCAALFPPLLAALLAPLLPSWSRAFPMRKNSLRRLSIYACVLLIVLYCLGGGCAAAGGAGGTGIIASPLLTLAKLSARLPTPLLLGCPVALKLSITFLRYIGLAFELFWSLYRCILRWSMFDSSNWSKKELICYSIASFESTSTCSTLTAAQFASSSLSFISYSFDCKPLTIGVPSLLVNGVVMRIWFWTQTMLLSYESTLYLGMFSRQVYVLCFVSLPEFR